MDRSEGGIRGVEPSPTQEPIGIAQPQTQQVARVATALDETIEFLCGGGIEDEPTMADAARFLLERLNVVAVKWRPAEEAPKTGEHFLAADLSRNGFGVCGGREQYAATVVHWYPGWGEEGADAGFYTSVNEQEPQRPFAFTHWMALPDGSASDRVTDAEDLGTGRRDTNNTPPPL